MDCAKNEPGSRFNLIHSGSLRMSAFGVRRGKAALSQWV